MQAAEKKTVAVRPEMMAHFGGHVITNGSIVGTSGRGSQGSRRRCPGRPCRQPSRSGAG
jgi:hypothetical protein